MDLEHLTKAIEKLRKELHELTEGKKTLDDEEIIKKSEALDILIVKYSLHKNEETSSLM